MLFHSITILAILAALIIILILLASFLFLLIYPFFFGAGYEPTDKKTLQEMIQYSKPLKHKKVADLGSGDGRMVIEFAKLGVESHGYEINPFFVWLSRRKIKKLNLQSKAFIHHKNFWKENLSPYNTIIIFQYSYLMPKLEKKLLSELKRGSLVLSNKWIFPKLKTIKQIGRLKVYKI